MHMLYFSLYCTPAVIDFVVYNNPIFTKLGGKEPTIFSISLCVVFFFFLKNTVHGFMFLFVQDTSSFRRC